MSSEQCFGSYVQHPGLPTYGYSGNSTYAYAANSAQMYESVPVSGGQQASQNDVGSESSTMLTPPGSPDKSETSALENPNASCQQSIATRTQPEYTSCDGYVRDSLIIAPVTYPQHAGFMVPQAMAACSGSYRPPELAILPRSNIAPASNCTPPVLNPAASPNVVPPSMVPRISPPSQAAQVTPSQSIGNSMNFAACAMSSLQSWANASPATALACAVAANAHQPRRSRSERKPVPDTQKDRKYFERRQRNNAAAKKSRDTRKSREDDISVRATFLEKENAILRAQVSTLREEASSLRQLIIQRRSFAGRLA